MYRCALFIGLCLVGAGPSVSEIHGMHHPALSPDGTEIAFDWHGDIWIAPSGGGKARRVTDDSAHEQKPCWSPDGKKLAFSSDRAGNLDLYEIELATRKVRQLTCHSADDDAPSWSSDGKWIAFESNRDSNLDLPLNSAVWDLWKMPADGGTATRLTRFRGENPSWSPDGKWVAYDRYSSGYADGEHNIFLISSDGSGIPRELASGSEDSRHPVFLGSQVFFAHEANGTKQASPHRNIWRASVNGGALIQVTGHHEEDVKWPTTCRGSTLMVYERGFEFYSIDLAETLPLPRRLSITTSFSYEDPAEFRTYTTGFRTPAWSPSGSRIAFASHGQIWIADADGRQARALTLGAGERRDPSWTSDESRIIYVEGSPGAPGHICSVDRDGGLPRRLSAQEKPYRGPNPSPNGEQIAYALPAGPSAGIWILDLKSGRERKIAGQDATEYEGPRYSRDGGSIAWLSTRSGKTAVESARVDGSRPVSWSTPEAKSGLSWSPDGTLIAFGAASGDGGWKLKLWEPGSFAERSLDQPGRNPSWSPDGSMILAEIDRGQGPENQVLVIVDARSSQRLALDIKATRPVTRREEMLGLFLQVWSSYAGQYYDPFFHGVDWTAMREKYREAAQESQTKTELYNVINDMIRELHSSHIHLTPPPPKNSVSTGSMAADLELGADGSLRLTRVEPGGPADRAGLHEGDVIVSAEGRDLAPGTDLDQMMTADAPSGIPTVSLTVRTPLGEVRAVPVRGIDRAELRELKYENRIAWRKKFTRERSGGRLAYHHIKMMVQSEVTRLRKALQEDFTDAEGLVLDERDGVGGLAHRPLCSLLDSTAPDRLNAAPVCVMRNRNGTTVPDKYGPGTQGGRASGKSWDRPVILVMNEISRSDKEIFPFTFRSLGIGYLVGMPTAGGVIGGNEWVMADGSRITVSVQGWFSADGRNLEGYGVPPDYRVGETHEDLMAGRDAPLEKAIEVLLAQMDGKIASPRKPGHEKKTELQQGK